MRAPFTGWTFLLLFVGCKNCNVGYKRQKYEKEAGDCPIKKLTSPDFVIEMSQLSSVLNSHFL